MTWIRRHEGRAGEPTDLVRDGWSWDDVGRALGLAGIRYQTGAAISGDLLRKKACKARVDEHHWLLARARRKAAVALAAEPQVAPAQPPVVERQAPTTISPAESSSPSLNSAIMDEEEPEFRPARLLNWSGKLCLKEEPPHPAPVIRSEAGDVDGVIAKLLGKRC